MPCHDLAETSRETETRADLEVPVRVSPTSPLMAIVAFMPCCVARPRLAGAQTPGASTRVMKLHGLLRQRDGEGREQGRHDGRIAVDQRNTRRCSEGPHLTVSCQRSASNFCC